MIVEVGKELVVARWSSPHGDEGDTLILTNWLPQIFILFLLCFTIIDDQLACCEDKGSDGIFFLKINQGRRVALSQSQLGHLSPAVIFDIVFKDIVVIIRFLS